MTAREQRRSLECIQEGSKGAYYRVSVYGIDYINRLVRLKTETYLYLIIKFINKNKLQKVTYRFLSR